MALGTVNNVDLSEGNEDKNNVDSPHVALLNHATE